MLENFLNNFEIFLLQTFKLLKVFLFSFSSFKNEKLLYRKFGCSFLCFIETDQFEMF